MDADGHFTNEEENKKLHKSPGVYSRDFQNAMASHGFISEGGRWWRAPVSGSPGISSTPLSSLSCRRPASWRHCCLLPSFLQTLVNYPRERAMSCYSSPVTPNVSLKLPTLHLKGFPGGLVVRNLLAKAGDLSLIPGLGRSPWRRKWQPMPRFVPEESHGPRS